MSPAPWRLERDGSWSRDKPDDDGDYAALVSWHERERWWWWTVWCPLDQTEVEGAASSADLAMAACDGAILVLYPGIVVHVDSGAEA